MINITQHEGNDIYYYCDCGTRGKCMVKPLGDCKANLVNIKCPICDEVEKVMILSYKDDDEREELLNNLNEMDMGWSLVLNNKVLED